MGNDHPAKDQSGLIVLRVASKRTFYTAAISFREV
jgi:hypothetical protein